VPSTHATGVHVRHAVSRALATNNIRPTEATFKVLTARVTLSSTRRIRRAEVTLSIRKPRPITQWEPHEITGWVNPDGEHPQMTLVRLDNPLFVDLYPVTWDSWLRVNVTDRLPNGRDPFCPRTPTTHHGAVAFASAVGKRLPTKDEMVALWGEQRWPWGDVADDHMGRVRSPQQGNLFEVGMHPPYRGMFDLGGWLWQLDQEGTAGCATVDDTPRFGHPATDIPGPLGFRCVVDP